MVLICNFVYYVCGCDLDWIIVVFIDEVVGLVWEQVGNKCVLLVFFGGVDLFIFVFLFKKVIGDQFICMFIDQGFMWKGEFEFFMDFFDWKFNIYVEYINVCQCFIGKLKGIIDLEEKCKIIGIEFICVFEEESKWFGFFDYLVQGMFYFDVIESVGINVDFKMGEWVVVKIKSYYNVGGFFKDFQFKLVEFLCKLFKDEVCKVGCSFGLFEEIVCCYFFLGFGLVICILGEVIDEKLDCLCDVDLIVCQEIKEVGLYYDIWQVFVVLLFVCFVGVMGDKCIYVWLIVLCCVFSEDGMIVDWFCFFYDLMEIIFNWIVNEVKGVNWVVFDIISKFFGMIEWE